MYQNIICVLVLALTTCILIIMYRLQNGDSLFKKVNIISMDKSDVKVNKHSNLFIGIVILILIISLIAISIIEYNNNENLININESSYTELKSLYGIGEVRASLIISNRPYNSKKELIEILGIDTYENIKHDIKK